MKQAKKKSSMSRKRPTSGPAKHRCHPVIQDLITTFTVSKSPHTWLPIILGTWSGVMAPAIGVGIKRGSLIPAFESAQGMGWITPIVLLIIVAACMYFSGVKMARFFGDLYGKGTGIALTILLELTLLFAPVDMAMVKHLDVTAVVNLILVASCAGLLVFCNAISAARTLRVFEPAVAAK